MPCWLSTRIDSRGLPGYSWKAVEGGRGGVGNGT